MADVSSVCKSCWVVIGDRKLLADLIVLPMSHKSRFDPFRFFRDQRRFRPTFGLKPVPLDSNSVKRSVCGIEAPVRKLVFRTRMIEDLELVPDPPGDRQRHLKDSIAWCRYSIEHRGFYSVALRTPPSMKVHKLARGLVTSDYLSIWQEIPITELFFSEVTIFLLGIVCSPPLPSSGGVQCDLGDQEE
ncbi:hypothetical protein PanWU01x14_310970 [Parasponia andersonii]|uniref:Uncharacterized protein n=1 Tax=Parasponia andersonii TaxID=3476 RepID=A0A2P5AQB0_PARAD|nr:hypothetical protein PanWU01x14_310970 [Parasponia andersonii]